jgi:hypothetical protein
MSEIRLAVDAAERDPSLPIPPRCLELAASLTRWEVSVHADGPWVVFRGCEGMIYDMQRGDFFAALVHMRGGFYRLALRVAAAATTLQ